MNLVRQPSCPIGRGGRVLSQELLESADSLAAGKNLRDIARINRWFGGHRTLLLALNALVHPQEQFSVLDVGAASGDMARCIRRRFPKVWVCSLDQRNLHLLGAPEPRVVADAFHLPFLRNSFDFVLCSSFLHHFPDQKVVELIAAFRRCARRALIVLDLERHPLSYHFLPMTRRILGWSQLTVHDGPVSVASGFRGEELADLAWAAGAHSITVQRRWPWFRLSAVVPADIAAQSAHDPDLPETDEQPVTSAVT